MWLSKTIHGCSLHRGRLWEQHIISFRVCHATCTVFLHNAMCILREIQTALENRYKQIQHLDHVVVIPPFPCYTLTGQSSHKHLPALDNQKNKHSFTLKFLLDVDNGEKKAEKQGRHCLIHHLTLQPSPAKDTAVPKPCLLCKHHPLPRADTSRLAVRKIIWS